MSTSTKTAAPSGAAAAATATPIEQSREAMLAFTEAAFGIAGKVDRFGRAQLDHGIAAATETADLMAGSADEMIRARDAVRASTLRWMRGLEK